MDSISQLEARRIALTAQGFGEPKPRKPGPQDMKRVIDRLRLIQIDSVNVLVRAHYMPFFSRLGPYRREMLDELAYRDQYVFEQWAHVACFIPIADYPLLRHSMADGNRWWRKVPEARIRYFDSVLEQVRATGPVVTGELESAGSRQGWWNWSDVKIALEYQFARGRLAVRDRRNFARVYDLAERVFPAAVLERPGHAKEDAERQVLRNSLRSVGLGTVNDLRYAYRVGAANARQRMAELADAGHARPVRVEGWKDDAYLDSSIHEVPDVSATALLSPFDNLVWDRPRNERLFGFNYRIEIYTPAPKRVYGYYVLPFMHENAMAARVDLKANRQASALQVQAAHLEPGGQAARTASALSRELRSMARWLGMERVVVEPRGDLAVALAAAFER